MTCCAHHDTNIADCSDDPLPLVQYDRPMVMISPILDNVSDSFQHSHHSPIGDTAADYKRYGGNSVTSSAHLPRTSSARTSYGLMRMVMISPPILDNVSDSFQYSHHSLVGDTAADYKRYGWNTVPSSVPLPRTSSGHMSLYDWLHDDGSDSVHSDYDGDMDDDGDTVCPSEKNDETSGDKDSDAGYVEAVIQWRIKKWFKTCHDKCHGSRSRTGIWRRWLHHRRIRRAFRYGHPVGAPHSFYSSPPPPVSLPPTSAIYGESKRSGDSISSASFSSFSSSSTSSSSFSSSSSSSLYMCPVAWQSIPAAGPYICDFMWILYVIVYLYCCYILPTTRRILYLFLPRSSDG